MSLVFGFKPILLPRNALMFRRSLLDLAPEVGVNVSQPNVQGMTPLAVATQNKQEATMKILKAHGAQ